MAAASMKRAGKCQRHGRPGDANRPIFQRLAHHFEHVAREFRQFVEKQDSVVRQRYLARPRNRSAADQACVGDRVMRRAKRSHPDQARARVEHARHAVNLRRLQSFFERKRRQNGRHPFRQHGLAGTGGTNHQNVVTARAGHFEGALGGLLAANIFEIRREMLRLRQQLIGVDLKRETPLPELMK